MTPEVRYHMLRPGQIVARRTACPVAYVPIGTIEWHGVHNPTGADTLQAEGLALLCAQKGGGLVFPPLYYGESRLEALMEANAADRDQIAAGMDLSPDNLRPNANLLRLPSRLSTTTSCCCTFWPKWRAWGSSWAYWSRGTIR